MEGPIVEVEQGKLQGKNCDGYSLFKSIPYAKPPVGDLRFLAPVPPESWNGIRDATKNCDMCAQFDLTTRSVVGSEDCLYLNVSTPKLPPGDLLPVMFYLHGGGFMFGTGTDESAHGTEYLTKKNVVVVSINYRLGVFGFACLDRKEATGNMGLRDQVQALKWVKKNISKFGGDPNNVTIFGISAGGASVEYLMLSPMAKGLFHKAIAQSGSSLLPWSQNDQVRELTRKIPAEMGHAIDNDSELLAYLKKMSTKELAQASVMLMSKTKHQGGIYFGFVPTVEKTGGWEAFLDKSPYAIIKEGRYNIVPFITGFCRREGLIMNTFNVPLNKLLNEKNFIEFIDEFFGIDSSKAKEISQKLTSAYEKDDEFDEPDAFAIAFFSDVDFIGGIYTAASLMVKHNPSIYFYEFAFDGNLNHFKAKMNIKRKGACHADDGGYLMKADLLKSANVTETDKLVRGRMIEMWTNFSKYGVPTSTKDTNEIIPTNWEPMGPGMKYLVIDEHLSMRQDPYPNRTHLFKWLFDTFYSKKN